MKHLPPEKLMQVTRHLEKSVYFQAELVEYNETFVWAISLGEPESNVTLTGESASPLKALSQMRNMLLIMADVGNDLLLDVKSAIDILTEGQNNGTDPSIRN